MGFLKLSEAQAMGLATPLPAPLFASRPHDLQEQDLVPPDSAV